MYRVKRIFVTGFMLVVISLLLVVLSAQANPISQIAAPSPVAVATNSAAPFSVSGRVWHDLDVSRDGVPSAVDSLFAGVIINLMTAADNMIIRQTVTDQNGVYSFEEMAVGEYVVAVDSETLPVNKQVSFAQSYEADGVLDLRHTVIITEADAGHSEVNFSFVAADFGDLPESYSTVGINAPFHAVVSDGSQIMLGNDISLEADGQPDESAYGDVDEGVITPHNFNAGQTTVIELAVSGDVPPEGALIGVWLDWDHNGQFSEEEFLVFTVLEGVNQLPIAIPDDFVPDALAIRFRLFSPDYLIGGTLDWTDYEGGAINGEIEDYVSHSYGEPDDFYSYTVTPTPIAESTATPISTPVPTPVVLGIDYGDLPESYGTGDDVPSHIVLEGYTQGTLGESITVEESGVPSAAADSDTDDSIEIQGDTALFYNGETGQTSLNLFVAVDAPTAIGYYDLYDLSTLGVWVDWDHNGSFSQDEFHPHNPPSGHIFAERTVSIVAPDNYQPNEKLAVRLRLFVGEFPGGSFDWTDYKGQVTNGEVEDYILNGIPFDLTTLPVSTPAPRPTLPPIIAEPFTVSGRVWHDLDASRDNAPTPNDEPFAGVILNLMTAADDVPDDENLLQQTITDLNGAYRFQNLPVGEYVVGIDLDSLPEDKQETFAWSYETDGVLDLLQTVTITEADLGQNDVNFSYVAGDFGDLPHHSFSTVGTNAPFHAIVSDGSQIMLGNGITIEADGQPDLLAYGDIDEGVPYPRILIRPNQTAIFEVFVSGAVPSDGAVLGTWFDWNHNIQFEEDEFMPFRVLEGKNLLPITPPEDYEVDALGGRFRLFSPDYLPGGTLDWTDYEGAAINGEVEDYVYVEATAITTRSMFTTPTLSPLSASMVTVTACVIMLLLAQGVARRGRKTSA